MCKDEILPARNWRLYHLLDLVRPTTARQVKWNFRKVTLRHHYFQAYLVLYNRSRKYLYDSIGEDAYGFIASGTWGPFVPVLGAVGSVILYSLVLMIEVVLLGCFFVLLAMHDAAYMSLSLEMITLPLMIFVSIMVAITAMAVVVNLTSLRTYREGMSNVDRLSPAGNFLASVCYLCITFVMVFQIRDDPASGMGFYMQYMSMPILGDVLYYATSLIWRWPRRLRLQMEVGNTPPSPLIYKGIFAMGFLHMLCGVAQWVLIGLKLDGRLNRSWFTIFVPFCVRTGLRIAEAYLRSLMKRTIGVHSAMGVAFDTVGSFFSNGMLLFSLYLVAVRIERGRQAISLAWALIPVFSTLGWLLFGLIVTMILLLLLYSRSSRAERLLNSRWTPPQDNNAAKILGGTDTSDSAPAPFLKTSQRDWYDVDAAATPASAFASARNDRNEYEDYIEEEEEPAFPGESLRLSQMPYGRSESDVDKENYSDTTPTSRQGGAGGYEAARHRSTKRRGHDPVASASHSVSARDVSGSASLRASRRFQAPLESDMTGSGTSYDDYTEATTHLNRTSLASLTEDVRGSSSYTYTGASMYSDEETEYTGESESASHTRSSSFASSGPYSAPLSPTPTRGSENKS
ncbi:hypothetical protein JKF63_00878 [Porcisia hertigi]|uniref:Uncharacterized protein n=1 Tax=Porcisia hertigi TaxID=2761500 RepID=A0A836HCG1_9TRYP|nr:hypothetical protein JKF63_00878 [Porcisia hertigi]